MYNRMAKLQGGAMGGEDSIFGMGKSQAKIAQSNVKFSDVAGIEEEKEELIEIVDYLKNPDKYAAMGARTPRGVILYGPPGTGKTLLAKAVAGEAKVPFFQVSGSAFEDMLVGVGAKRVRDLFAKAKKAAPAIIFIDELDSVASKRGKYDISGSAGLADQTINQLLAEMDGFSTRTGVVVMAATNRLDVIDDAILRPGRFDRHIQVNLPDIKEREAILKIHSRNKNLSSKVNLEEIARRTPGFSGAQLENVLNEATLLAVRLNKSSVGMEEIDEAIDRVIAGPAKKSRVITDEEKKQIAYHEAGHALVGLHLPGSDVVEKITIIPRGMAAGYTLLTPEKQEIQIQKKSDLLAIITSTLGGRASEEVIYGKDAISTGASNDLYKVTNIVRSMVTQLGMTELGMTQFIPSEGVVNPAQVKLYSDETAKKIDAQIEKIIQTQYDKAKKIISANKKELDLIVKSLL
ncbi:MAG: ATP-dependent zinc metalloprotease FtsH, partial [Mycoplasmoidaceae bacterium]|nr:ATP-dependent zinc metalloprotease FtsH [Mycoplasmoidaceae bacterium]